MPGSPDAPNAPERGRLEPEGRGDRVHETGRLDRLGDDGRTAIPATRPPGAPPRGDRTRPRRRPGASMPSQWRPACADGRAPSSPARDSSTIATANAARVARPPPSPRRPRHRLTPRRPTRRGCVHDDPPSRRRCRPRRGSGDHRADARRLRDGGVGRGRADQRPQPERRAFAGDAGALDRDVAAHQLGEPAADREAQAGSPEAAAGRDVRLAERLEQATDPVRRDA